MLPDLPAELISAHGLLRRRVAAAVLVAAPALLLGVRAQPAAALRPTPAQTEGPFYPLVMPADADYDLLRNGALDYPEGRRAWLEGRVADLAGRPLAGAQVEIWQCDHAGHYHHPGDGDLADKRFQGFGRVTVAADGSYRFRTIRPVRYSGRTPHIHVKVRLGNNELLTTQVYVANDPGNPRDSLWRSLSAADRAALTVDFAPGGDGLQASFPIVVAT
jgi:protocatechuate 3,4-dioxygenase beta subunit